MRAPAGTTVTTAVVAATLLVAPWVASEHRDATEVDVSSLAITASHAPVVTDDAFDVRRLHGREVASETSATATSDCDGCSATSVAVTVSYVGAKDTVRAENVSSAWSSCAGCQSHAVSVQVVVLDRAAAVHADNRALAVAAACDECATSAVAYQLVVVADHQARFDREALDELRQWARAQAEVPATSAQVSPERRSAPGAAAHGRLAELEEHTAAALGPVTTLRRDADVVVTG